MDSTQEFYLKKHRLQHLPELRVKKEFFEPVFATGCSMMNCNAKCCREGVWADPAEKDRILAHTEMIQKYMEPHQDKDPSTWFDGEETEDPDFPSGKAIGTQARSYGCVFLKANGHCVLQHAAVEEGMSKFALKPFFCFAFPVAIEFGELVLDDPDFTYREECCAVVKNGNLSVLDVCAEELEFMLGTEGYQELQSVAKQAMSNIR